MTLAAPKIFATRGEAKGYRLIFGYLGAFIAMIGGITLIPLLMIIVFPNEWRCWPSFFLPGITAIFLGVLIYLLCLYHSEKGKMGRHMDALLLVLLWVMALLIGAFPFFLNGYLVPGAEVYTYSESVFEAASGYTATGLTIYRSFFDTIIYGSDGWTVLSNEAVQGIMELNAPHIFFFYRSVCHFFGGVGLVLVAASAISDAHGMKLYTAEGHNDKLFPNLKKSARMILGIYSLYIVLGTLGLWLFGMDWFDALCHSTASIATGGLSTRCASFHYFLTSETADYIGLSSGCSFSNLSGFNNIMPVNTVGMEITIIILMILGATNFVLHMHLFTGKWKKFFRDCEVRLVIAISFIFVPMMLVSTLINSAFPGAGALTDVSFWDALRYSVFQFISCLTTTGFANVADINALGPAVLFLSIVAMTIGGGMGSTAGALKQYRVVILGKEVYWHLKYRNAPKRMVYPKPITRMGERRQVSHDEAKEASLYFIIYIVTLSVGVAILAALPNITFDQAIYEVASSLSGTGNSMINFYPYASNSYAAYNPVAAYNFLLWICTFYMFLGRLEIIPVYYAANHVYHDVHDGIAHRRAARLLLKRQQENE